MSAEIVELDWKKNLKTSWFKADGAISSVLVTNLFASAASREVTVVARNWQQDVDIEVVAARLFDVLDDTDEAGSFASADSGHLQWRLVENCSTALAVAYTGMGQQKSPFPRKTDWRPTKNKCSHVSVARRGRRARTCRGGRQIDPGYAVQHHSWRASRLRKLGRWDGTAGVQFAGRERPLKECADVYLMMEVREVVRFLSDEEICEAMDEEFSLRSRILSTFWSPLGGHSLRRTSVPLFWTRRRSWRKSQGSTGNRRERPVHWVR